MIKILKIISALFFVFIFLGCIVLFLAACSSEKYIPIAIFLVFIVWGVIVLYLVAASSEKYIPISMYEISKMSSEKLSTRYEELKKELSKENLSKKDKYNIELDMYIIKKEYDRRQTWKMQHYWSN